MASDISRAEFRIAIRSFLAVDIRLNLWLVVSLPAPVVQLDRATASGAVGCAFEPRRAHSLSNMVFTGKMRTFRFRMFAHQNARITSLFAKFCQAPITTLEIAF